MPRLWGWCGGQEVPSGSAVEARLIFRPPRYAGGAFLLDGPHLGKAALGGPSPVLSVGVRGQDRSGGANSESGTPDGWGRTGLTVSCWSLESALSFMPAAGGGAQDAGAGMAQLHPTAAGSLVA